MRTLMPTCSSNPFTVDEIASRTPGPIRGTHDGCEKNARSHDSRHSALRAVPLSLSKQGMGEHPRCAAFTLSVRDADASRFPNLATAAALSVEVVQEAGETIFVPRSALLSTFDLFLDDVLVSAQPLNPCSQQFRQLSALRQNCVQTGAPRGSTRRRTRRNAVSMRHLAPSHWTCTNRCHLYYCLLPAAGGTTQWRIWRTRCRSTTTG
jgi:hypothetical protein